MKLPSPLICTIGVCCGHTKATIQCYSCSRFKGGRGFYCAECFEARHPWYRAAHSWVKLGDSPDSENELETQIHRTDLEREVADTRGMLQAISLWQREIKFQHADTKGDDLIKEATRHATRVATKIRDLADATCEDRTKVPHAAVEGVVAEAVRFQKGFEVEETFNENSAGFQVEER